MPLLSKEHARKNIGALLGAGGWTVQGHNATNLGAARGSAIRKSCLTTLFSAIFLTTLATLGLASAAPTPAPAPALLGQQHGPQYVSPQAIETEKQPFPSPTCGPDWSAVFGPHLARDNVLEAAAVIS